MVDMINLQFTDPRILMAISDFYRRVAEINSSNTSDNYGNTSDQSNQTKNAPKITKRLPRGKKISEKQEVELDSPISPPQENVEVSVKVAQNETISKGPTTFTELMLKIANGLISKALDQNQVSAACAKVGLTGIISLKDRPDLVEEVEKELGLRT